MPPEAHMTDTADPSPLRRTACFACTKAKRRCTKETPGCRRCHNRGLLCKYPPLKMMVELPVSLETAFIGDFSSSSNSGGDSLHDVAPAGLPWHQELQHPSSLTVDDASLAPPPLDIWFLSPDSWKIDQRPSSHDQPSFRDGALRFFTQQTLAWLKQWVNEGHCPFIHSQLYQQDSPGSIQIAYSTCAAYFSKTVATSPFVLRILEDQSTELISSGNKSESTVMSTRQHLARTQALLTYQAIRLFDGDIRSRAQAEDNLDLLVSWATKMWESASLDAASATSLTDYSSVSANAFYTANSQPNTFQLGGSVSALWQAWYITESVRRTYVLAAFLQGVYQTMKQGWAYCPGGVTFSMRAGLWDATSAPTWVEGFHHEHTPQSMESKQPETAFINARPTDVDDFAKCILTVSRGLECVEEWIAQKGLGAYL